MQIDNNKQKFKRLPALEARTLLVELMHEGYDTYCSEIDGGGNLIVIWPASTDIGKQLEEPLVRTEEP